MLDEIKLNQLAKLQLDNHPNVYYTYGEDGLVRELRPVMQGNKAKKAGKKRPQSKKKA